jgi:predicted O-methyltransferase YrrM
VSDVSPSVIELFQKLLSEPDGKKLFADAVASALAERPFNLDTMKYVAASVESYKYAAVRMADKRRFPESAALLRYAAQLIKPNAPVLEFGVFKGGTLNFLASLLPGSKVYGFDAFEGLPENWTGTAATKGMFSQGGKLPDVHDNVELVVGWFDRTLPFFFDTHDIKEIGLLHVDCDIYSSTQTIFAHLHEKIVPGTIIVFDEYFNYPNWEQHEYRAFQEYVAFRQVKYEYIGLVPTRFGAAVRIL